MRFLNIYTFFNPFNYIHANFYVSSSHFQMLLLNYFQISRSFLNVTLKRLFDDPTISHPIETTEITRRVTVLGRKGHHSTWPWAPFGPTQGIQRTQERTWSMSFRLFLRDFHSLSLSPWRRGSRSFSRSEEESQSRKRLEYFSLSFLPTNPPPIIMGRSAAGDSHAR